MVLMMHREYLRDAPDDFCKKKLHRIPLRKLTGYVFFAITYSTDCVRFKRDPDRQGANYEHIFVADFYVQIIIESILCMK
jgi:hypothetical protein